jgi:hypothetical protein
MVCSLAIPWMNFRWFSIRQASYPPVNGLLSIIHPAVTADTPPSIHWKWIPFVVCFAVSGILLVLLLLRIVGIFRLKKKYGSIRMNGLILVETDLANAPFSFGNFLFWRKNISREDENGQKIWMHELTHIREKHTYDKLFSQIVSSILWMNPFYWIIQKELNLVHEFIADGKSIPNGDSALFAKMLLEGYNEGRHLDPSHPFFQTSIKRRLFMITHSNKTSFSYVRRLLALPVAVLATAVFSFNSVSAQNDTVSTESATKKVDRIKAREHISTEAALTKLSPAEKEAFLKKNNAQQLERSKDFLHDHLDNMPDVLILVNEAVSSKEAVRNMDYATITKLSIRTAKEKAAYAHFLDSAEGKEWIAKYGEKVKNGIVEITTK